MGRSEGEGFGFLGGLLASALAFSLLADEILLIHDTIGILA